jgi:hypothetical protein
VSAGVLGVGSFNAKYGGSTTSDDAFRQIESFANSERFEEGMNHMKQNSSNESITYTDSSGKNTTSTIDEAMRTSQDYSTTLSNMEQLSQIQNTNQTHKYIDHLENNYDQKTVEGILNHKDGNYSDQRTESINSFMENQPSVSRGNHSSHMDDQNVGSREFLSKFEDNSTQTRGYSNSSLKEEVPNMTSNANWNINHREQRFENNFQNSADQTRDKANDNVVVGAFNSGMEKVSYLAEKISPGLGSFAEDSIPKPPKSNFDNPEFLEAQNKFTKGKDE